MSFNRELDVEVAKKVLKLQVWFDHIKNEWYCYNFNNKDRIVVLPRYSENSDHAYVIVNTLQTLGLTCHVGSVLDDGNVKWRATFFKRSDATAVAVYGDTMAQAICFAALKHFPAISDNKTSANAEIITFPKK